MVSSPKGWRGRTGRPDAGARTATRNGRSRLERRTIGKPSPAVKAESRGIRRPEAPHPPAPSPTSGGEGEKAGRSEILWLFPLSFSPSPLGGRKRGGVKSCGFFLFLSPPLPWGGEGAGGVRDSVSPSPPASGEGAGG